MFTQNLLDRSGHGASAAPIASSPLVEFGLLIVLAVIWGLPYALTKISLETIPPLTLVAARVSVAAAILWVIVVALRRKIPCQRTFVGRSLLQSGLGCLIPYTLTTWGQQTTDSALAAILNSTSPLFVCLVTVAWTRHEPITFGRLAGVSAGLGGVLLVTGVGALNGVGQNSAGQVAILLATVSLALGTLHGRRFAGVAPEVTVAAMLTWSAILLLPISFVVEEPSKSVPSAPSIMALLANAIFPTAFGFVLYFRLIRTIGSMSAASIGYIKPAIGVIIGCLVLGEAFSGILALGLAAILTGVVFINADPSAALCRTRWTNRLFKEAAVAAVPARSAQHRGCPR
jgi:drug/metabolite transporter (DMT)-like permease